MEIVEIDPEISVMLTFRLAEFNTSEPEILTNSAFVELVPTISVAPASLGVPFMIPSTVKEFSTFNSTVAFI